MKKFFLLLAVLAAVAYAGMKVNNAYDNVKAAHTSKVGFVGSTYQIK